MVYRDRKGLSPTNDPIQTSNNRDRYLDNCFLLCINRNDDTDIPEIHRLDNNNLMRELCNKNPLNQIKSQQKSKAYLQNQRGQTIENYDYDYDDDNDDNNDDDNIINLPKQQKDRDYIYRRKQNQYDRDSQFITNRSKYQRDNTIDNYYNYDQYSRTPKYNHYRNNYNIMQHSDDDELSVYEVYVPTNTLNRLGDKRLNNNMVLIDYEDVSMLRDIRQPTTPYGYPQQNISPQYNNYAPLNQYNEYGLQYPYDLSSDLTRIRDGQQPFYQNNLLQQQQQPRLDSPQSGPLLPTNIPIDQSNTINIRRHIYSPSQLPQGLTEGQLVMLLQKGSQYQQIKSAPTGQLFPIQKETQPSSTAAVVVAPQATLVPSTPVEALKSPPYVPSAQIKMSQVPPQIIDHSLTNDDKISIVDEITKPMSTLYTTNSIRPLKDIVESREESKEKKKDKISDEKKDKKSEKDGSHKKDSKKEKSSGKDAKKKKK
ncbi:unnamed protein product [Rotaria sordida]|uniref:Uncharacterized protein n=1 Tax=Rotaria sordida TaxID=392033 RepID=A0A818XTS0_9BILA|nr:unnamed protein product [Rotaria sordida]